MIKITSIELDGHQISVPAGLSELLANGNGWGTKQEKLHVGYSREVVKRDGKLITVLRKR
ncbi:hypothetical protein [Paucisalibacillus globulus]|uniref:hypothetical protein n=1 Tax=Paucisalibacillus globulus TaxID=351095 RepID=UPI000BB89222|nr:hypothetical protein [Paucisalibacillus globulus]